MRCPVCKADNNLTPQCRRCKADLTLLVALEQRRTRVLAEARACLVHGKAEAASEWASEADWLRSDEVSHRLMALARLIQGDFAGAWAASAVPRGPASAPAASGVA